MARVVPDPTACTSTFLKEGWEKSAGTARRLGFFVSLDGERCGGFLFTGLGPWGPQPLAYTHVLAYFCSSSSVSPLGRAACPNASREAKQLPEQLPTLLLGALNPILYCRSPLGKPYSIIKAHSYGSSAFCVYLLQDEGSCTRSVQTEFHGLEEKLV